MICMPNSSTLLFDAGVPVHVLATRCSHHPAVLLRVYAKRTRKADARAAAIISALFQERVGGYLGTGLEGLPLWSLAKLGPTRLQMFWYFVFSLGRCGC